MNEPRHAPRQGEGVPMTIMRLAVTGLIASTALGSALAADMPTKAPPPPAETPFFLVNDTSIIYYHAFRATDPGVNTTPKDVLEINHFDVWKYGTNFFDIQALQSNHPDPTIPCTPPHT